MAARRTGLVPFFAAAFALMWVCFGAIATGRIAAGSPAGRLLILLGVFAPALAAVWQTSVGVLWICAGVFLAAMPDRLPFVDRSPESVDRQNPRAPRGATEHPP